MSKKTLRMTFPEWQGGVNPNYFFGSKLLTQIAPKGESCESVEVPVEQNFEEEQKIEGNFVAKTALIKQQKAAYSILEEKDPDKVITFGGDCSVEQAPIDYLHGKYEDMAIIWIDVHPDFSEPEDYPNEHAMVLGNLLGGGAKEMAEIVKHPFQTKDVMYAGLKAESMETYEKKHMKEYQIAYAGPEELAETSQPVLDWIEKNGYKKVYIHWDLDVLSPEDFRSLLCNEPHVPCNYVIGEMRLEQVTRVITDIAKRAEIVGIGITEYMPWDIIRLTNALKQISIFND